MTITTHIDKEANLRHHKVTGPLTKDELIEKLKEVYSEPDFDPDMNTLWDLREADLSSFFSPDIQEVRDFVSEHWGTGGKSRSALVVSRDLNYGLSRMYEAFLKGKTSSEVAVFRDYDDAVKWIKS